MTSSKRSWLNDILLLTLTLGIIYAIFLGSRPLMVPDEGRYAEIAREMATMGNFLTPHLNGIKYFEKPPLFYWIERSAIQFFGTEEWCLRFFPVLIGLIGCLAVYTAARKLYSRNCGLLAGLILASSALYVTLSHFVSPDLTLTVCLSISLLAFILGACNLKQPSRVYYFWTMYGFAALATLAKGLIGVVFPGLIILVWIGVFNKWRELKYYCLPSGFLLFVVITLPWHLAIQVRNPEFFKFYFFDQHLLRYLTDYAQRRQAIWFFPATVAAGFFPWVVFLLTSFPFKQLFSFRPQFFWQKRHQYEVTAFFVIWVLVLLVFFTLSRSLLISYALPALPPLAILLAVYFTPYWEGIPAARMPLNIGFLSVGFLGVGLSLAGLIAVHPVTVANFQQIYWYLSLILLAISSLLAVVIYQIKGFRVGFLTLFIGMSLFFVSLNFSYPTIDGRSIKPLALTLRPLLQPDTEVAAYHQYYQRSTFLFGTDGNSGGLSRGIGVWYATSGYSYLDTR